MNPDYNQLKHLFAQASDVPSEEREEFIAAHCGEDAALAGELRELLAMDERPLEIFEAPPDIYQVEEEFEPDAVPDYAIQRKIGEGGFGLVYEALQLHPIRRSVALKLIKHGFASATTKQRFAIECDALARLDHPSIARVFDAGTTPSGHLFCTMELIDGIPICDYANTHRLSVMERVGLMLPICEAIQQAHQRGILHRDLKPSNILVTSIEGRPLPKIIDFGIAKVRDPDDADHAEFTLSGEFIGTPIYMSPEQADPTQGGLDTRSDVYSLAVVLYELLTGTTPLQSEPSARPSLETVLRTLREDDAPLASKRVMNLGNDGELHAQRCGTKSETLVRSLRGDLDRVLAMALEKERSRRYESPQQFGADLARLQRNEAVLAQSPTTSYLLRKFARRHRGKLATAATVVTLLVLGVIGTTFGMFRAWDAQKKEASQRQVAESEEKRARLEARISGEIVAFLTDDLLASVSPENRGIDVTVRETLDIASNKIDGRFEDLPAVAVALRTTLGSTYLALGVSGPSLLHLEKARQLAQRTLAADDPRSLRASREYGAALYAAGQHQKATPILKEVLRRSERVLGPRHEDTIQCAFHLASAHAESPDQRDARKLVERWLPISESELGRAHPLTLRLAYGLGHIHSAEGNLREALAVFEDGFHRAQAALGATHRMTLMLAIELAQAKIQSGSPLEAERILRATFQASIQRLGERHPTTLNLKVGLAAALARRPERRAEAEKLLDELIVSSPKVLRPDHPLLIALRASIAETFRRIGRPERMREVLETLVAGGEESPTPQVLWAMSRLQAIAEKSGADDVAQHWKLRRERAQTRLKHDH